MNPDPPALRWWFDGEVACAGLVDHPSDDDLTRHSALPGRFRAHIVARLARNADALVSLLDRARTGVETPMYAARAFRDADTEATAARS